ncbi:MAG: hypothetical protein UY23_C0001G0350 [Candidatus Jorgensenbacteria bacterium GW2011_GWA1_48_11]|uniref:Thioredoxin domain-containing protein n=1 Tax=Candidatus Jorgensenbacteria bacterium GW2011_GWA1_48_11 TaxID=1618660 RepID=A0A0G1UCA5_9BACT|nr:MAG: hypothetical protein UY23_C0001G0350 [Candidatus Jorgensenbacteria bacterium GW2011_GWA1_48_11]KKW12235.1 MAG: hypothetical protein UY51_C0005G0477 [Candidatus Jorgensenbacteria bacterium GW2011_GWB1_49_9]
MKKDTKTVIGVLVLIVAAVVIVMAVSANRPRTPGKLDAFAACLKTSGVVFYGAYWCSHCQNQKAMFGKSEDLLPYVECSNPSGTGQTAICTQKGIQGYPTWIFKDGSELTGEVPLDQLAQKTGCALPQ